MKNGIQAKITAKNESALDRFVSKINAYSNTSMKGFAEFLADKAEEYLLGLYAGADDITVSVQMSDGGKTATVLVNGDQVSYLEFGTGIRGKARGYDGELPQQPIIFWAHGTQVVVHGWTYNYADELGITKTNWAGFQSQGQVWQTAQWLRKNIISLAREYFGIANIKTN